jgi:hypothetical protein
MKHTRYKKPKRAHLLLSVIQEEDGTLRVYGRDWESRGDYELLAYMLRGEREMETAEIPFVLAYAGRMGHTWELFGYGQNVPTLLAHVRTTWEQWIKEGNSYARDLAAMLPRLGVANGLPAPNSQLALL